MMFSVRFKLALLVGLPVVLTAAAMPLISASQHAELSADAGEHVEEAEQAFKAELEDDLANLYLAARVVASSEKTQRALRDSRSDEALEVAGLFAKLYPRMDVTLAARDGRVLGDVGPTQTPANITELPELPTLGSTEMRFLAAQGCAPMAAHAPPALAVLHPVQSVGWVLVCEALDEAYLENESDKLRTELAFVSHENVVLSHTTHFPKAAALATGERPVLWERANKTWTLHRFHVDALRTKTATHADVVAAVDITKTSASVHHHLRLMLGILGAIALVTGAFGFQIARVMSRGLNQVILAFRKLEQNQYIRVPKLRTKDEIELLATGFNQMVEGLLERDKLRTTFGKYMTESVLEHLLNGKVTLGGETLKVTILFSDIRSFTSISEKMDAHALVELLNEYFTEMVSIVMHNGGVVDKYIGDAIMAVFGAPVPTEQDAANAVRAAVQMRGALEHLNTRLVARGAEPLRTGIGIHTGEVVAGNIGSEQRMEYTVIGDPVNLASRLESNTKELGVDVLISETTYQETKDLVLVRPLRELSVKGRAEPVMTYELRGLRES